MTSIKEQISQNWEAALKTISKANNFENDIDLLERFHLGVMDEEKNLIMQTKQGSETLFGEQPIGIEVKALTMNTVIKIRHDFQTDKTPSDKLFNSVEQDHYKAVMADPTRGGLAQDTRFASSSEVEVSEDGTQGEKTLVYEVIYRHLLGDMSVN